ncbi:unnamed protein product [Cyclocybe aegerita]|uniref:Uncharacterized protein n=1 Tax=Cyclocybe aegerita TaxID=1973307 RepID=A0A8S0W1X3_CYCAE|nr:unnamed protein product [Cyclocybe aegerita]
MGDDHTPIEFSCILGSDGKHTIRFTLEPLSGVDGSPTPSRTWINALHEFSSIGNVQEFDTDWALTCFEMLVFEGNNVPKQKPLHSSQFSIGADFTHDGIVGKAYFLPHLRSQATGISQMDLVTSCMNELDLGSQWKIVASYFTEKVPHLDATPDIVAVDCVHKSKNRAKIYVRCNASSLNEITEVFTLGQRLKGLLINKAIEMIEEVWRQLFVGKNDDQRLESNNPDHFASRFVLYFELAPGREIPFPKLYIPIRHYCQNDALVGEALEQLYKEKYGIKETHLRDIQSAL